MTFKINTLYSISYKCQFEKCLGFLSTYLDNSYMEHSRNKSDHISYFYDSINIKYFCHVCFYHLYTKRRNPNPYHYPAWTIHAGVWGKSSKWTQCSRYSRSGPAVGSGQWALGHSSGLVSENPVFPSSFHHNIPFFLFLLVPAILAMTLEWYRWRMWQVGPGIPNR